MIAAAVVIDVVAVIIIIVISIISSINISLSGSLSAQTLNNYSSEIDVTCREYKLKTCYGKP